jgi:Uma2 family endonuclease
MIQDEHVPRLFHEAIAMSSMSPNRPTTVTPGEPVWEIATLFPGQGDWSEEEYLALDGNHLIEFTDGCVEVLPMPTMVHQLIVLYILDVLRPYVASRRLGRVLMAPFRLKTRPRKYREPDILFILAGHQQHVGNRFWTSADLVMEVVSPDDPERDYVEKRLDYAEAGIPEYWIVDPARKSVLVLTLRETGYEVHGEFGPGTTATSVLLPGFEVNVTDVFDQPAEG